MAVITACVLQAGTTTFDTDATLVKAVTLIAEPNDTPAGSTPRTLLIFCEAWHAPKSRHYTDQKLEQQGCIAMTIRPDPTFHASPKLAMEAPPENFAYTLLLSPDFSKPDALAVIDVKPGSPTYSKIVHTVTMPNKGDEFHHFGWNACSSALAPWGFAG
jgi:hypothetical protein